MSWKTWLVLSALLLTFAKEGAAFAEVQVFLIRLINSRGLGANGHCCDGRAVFCFSPCDHKLTICLDHSNGPEDARHCAYGSMTTGEVTNQNKVFFTSNIGGTHNPMAFPLPRWPGQIKLKVHIEDEDDHNSNDFVDFLSTVVSFTPGQPDIATIKYLTLVNRVTLVLELSIKCLPNDYGPHCSTRCVPRDDSQGHYSCDPSTGNKVCLLGWRGPECREVDRDDCLSKPCQHDGLCLQGIDGFVCICHQHTKGTLCEVNTKDDCVGERCDNNGTCLQRESGNICVCDPLWSGPHCLTRLVACSDLPCLQGGTCLGNPGNISCVCAEGFTGKFCDEDVDECQLGTFLCQNNGTCFNEVGSYSCICADGYSGARCEQAIDYCADEPCHFGGMCTPDPTGYTCACAAGRTGMHCEEDIEECASSPCKNGGVCVEEVNGYSCNCSTGFAGSQCEEQLDPCQEQPCQNEASCARRTQTDFRCVCAAGFEGTLCEVKVTSQTATPTTATMGKTGVSEMTTTQTATLPSTTLIQTSASATTTTETAKALPKALEKTSASETTIIQTASVVPEMTMATPESYGTDSDSSTSTSEVTTSDVTTSTPAGTSSVAAGKLKQPFYMSGELDDEAMGKVDRWLESLVKEYGGYSDPEVRVASQRKYVKMESGTTATEVTFSVVINKRQLLRWDEVDAILRSVPAEALTTSPPFTLVMGVPVVPASSSHLGSASTPATPMSMPEWYVFLGAALGVGIGILIAFLIFRRRKSIRRKLSDVTFLYRRHTFSPSPTPIFDNNVYFVHSSDPDMEDQQPTFDPTDLPGQGPSAGFSSCDIDSIYTRK